MIDTFVSLWETAGSIVGFDPMLMLPVFLLVSLIDKGAKLEERAGDWRKSIVGVTCIIMGALVSLLVEADSGRALITNAIYLGSVSALSYQIFKGLYVGVQNLIKDRFESRTGIKIEFED